MLDSKWSATPSNTLIHRLHTHSANGSMRWIAVIHTQGDEHRIALGSPEGNHTDLRLEFPEWFLESMGLSGTGEEVIVRFESCETMAKARSLTFKTLDVIPDWLDIRDVLEEPLSQLGVLKPGQLLPIPVLDSALLVLYSYEPQYAPFIFLDGDEIAIDVIYEGQEQEQEQEPPQEEEQQEQEQEQEQEQPQEEQQQEEQQEQPQQQQQQEQQQQPVTTPPLRSRGFVPFKGKGHVLGTGEEVWGL